MGTLLSCRVSLVNQIYTDLITEVDEAQAAQKYIPEDSEILTEIIDTDRPLNTDQDFLDEVSFSDEKFDSNNEIRETDLSHIDVSRISEEDADISSLELTNRIPPLLKKNSKQRN